jgi:hypothetical protein
MAEDRLGPEGQNCSHEDTTPIKLRVAHGIHTDVHPMQAPNCHAILDGTLPKAKLEQLPNGSHAMLPSSQNSQSAITWMTFSLHISL